MNEQEITSEDIAERREKIDVSARILSDCLCYLFDRKGEGAYSDDIINCLLDKSNEENFILSSYEGIIEISSSRGKRIGHGYTKRISNKIINSCEYLRSKKELSEERANNIRKNFSEIYPNPSDRKYALGLIRGYAISERNKAGNRYNCGSIEPSQSEPPQPAPDGHDSVG